MLYTPAARATVDVAGSSKSKNQDLAVVVNGEDVMIGDG
jgi:hypothetical protein